MPVLNEFEEFTIYMLEDLRPEFTARHIAGVGLAGIANADLTQTAIFLDGATGIVSTKPKRTLFKKRFVPRAFEILRRGYFNHTRRLYRNALDRITKLSDLHLMYATWAFDGYGPQALHLIKKRIAAISAPSNAVTK
ncbi:hypothetical protein B0H11DRAFT_1908913 [Mycena galericulata]|nr:hypothetical protein B0H11DRAFT_1908913 [Mycena galericulata]